MRPFALISCLCLLLGTTEAHPVAFKGATQITASYVGDVRSVEAYHTYDNGVAFGLDAEWMKMPDTDRYLAALQHNWLVHRWNLRAAQGNFYAGAGMGVADSSLEDASLFGRAAMQADFETRWIYTAFKSAVNAGENFTHFSNTASIGFAPYAHDTTGIATWIIVDFTYITEFDKDLRIIPKLRLFSGSWFLEGGVSLDGDPLISCMIHF